MADLFIGVDLGGTKINTVLADQQGQVIARDYRETKAAEGPDAVIGRMIAAARQVMRTAAVDTAQIQAIGVGAPGPLDALRGTIVAPPNLPGWRDVPLKQIIQQTLGITTCLENDANAAALGEHRFGAGQGTRHMIYVTVSTGIGGGFILDGQLYRGATGAAAEIGHMTVLPYGPRCGCGNRGCLEALASGTAIAREGQELVRRGMPGRIAELAHHDPHQVTARLVAEAAEQGDAHAQDILSQALHYLGIGLASLVNLLNPELIIIGGGLTKLGPLLYDTVRRVIDQRAFLENARAVRVMPPGLGDDVGSLGAVAVAMQNLPGK